jgi:hypothetical protein
MNPIPAALWRILGNGCVINRSAVAGDTPASCAIASGASAIRCNGRLLCRL